LLFDYFLALGAGEHFFAYRHVVKAQLEAQLAALAQSPAVAEPVGSPVSQLQLT
jgi:hypothetical protein